VVGIGMLIIGVCIHVEAFADLVSQSFWFFKYYYETDTFNINSVIIPEIGELLREAGFLPLLGVAVLIACVIPVFFIFKDYHTVKSIRTILRLPSSKTLYYLDKLIPPVTLLFVHWFIQYLALREAANIYIRAFPEEFRPTRIRALMWSDFPVNILYPFSEPSRIPAMISFLILIPATVILFVFAVKSGKRGIPSGFIACVGVFATVLYFMEFPVSAGLTPFVAATVIFFGILHINKLPII
jgi:hypothetical protein